MSETNVVIIGAGVIGLTTALLLTEDEKLFNVTIVAKHMPGDSDIEYASPWAGANWSIGASKRAVTLQEYEKETFPRLVHIAEHYPDAGIQLQHTASYNRGSTQQEREPFGQDFLLGFKHLETPAQPDAAPYVVNGQFPPGHQSANSYTSVCINSPVYCAWLLSKCLARGVKVKRANLSHLLDAGSLHQSGSAARVIINCSALGARNLAGCHPLTPQREETDPAKPKGDPAVFPIRGQIVLVRNSPGIMVDTPVRADAPTEVTYVMERAAGGGTILGGSYQPYSWESQPDPDLANRIMARAVETVPSLVDERALKGVSGTDRSLGGVQGLSVIRHGVGLRPAREGGARIERVQIGDAVVVHQYGHGGAGYQSSYGSARRAVELVKEGLRGSSSKAKL